jgi:hypothetical protein
METQPLVQPIRLELPNSALLSIKNNLEVFQKNGFQFLDEDKNSLDDGVYSSAIHLKTVPSIRNYKFDIEGNKKHLIYVCLIFFRYQLPSRFMFRRCIFCNIYPENKKFFGFPSMQNSYNDWRCS